MNKDRLLYAGEFLERNLFEPLTAEDLAAAAAMSLRSLQRHFADSVGESLASYVRGRRLTHAARQLVMGHPDILGLALDCQFGSHEAFTRAFRRHYFMSPSEFRDQGCLSHNYHRPVLDEAALAELEAQRQRPPLIRQVPKQTLWGLSVLMPTDQMDGLPLQLQTRRLANKLQALFGSNQAPRVFIYKTTPGQCQHFCVMVAVEAPPPASRRCSCRPAFAPPLPSRGTSICCPSSCTTVMPSGSSTAVGTLPTPRSNYICPMSASHAFVSPCQYARHPAPVTISGRPARSHPHYSAQGFLLARPVGANGQANARCHG